MIRVAQVNTIKDLYENEELSLREIARRTKLSFQTVQKYAYMEDWSEEKLPDLQAAHYPNLKDFIPIIDDWMEADRKVPRKQRHTAMRIYHRLQEELGYRGSYSSVKRYVSKKKLMMKLVTEGCLPLAQPKGQGQVDFGEGLYYDGQGQEHKGWALTVSFPQSNKGYTQLYPAQNQECLLTGLQRIFEHIGGVPPRLKFDNLSPALAGWTVQAKIFFDHVEFYHDHQLVAQCRRSYGRNEELLAQSKGWERKGALQLLSEIVNDGNAELCEEALAMAAENGRTDPDIVVAKSAHLRFRLRRKLCSLPCSSSPHRTRFAGLRWGPREGSVIT